MPVENSPDQEPKRQFIREKVVRPPMTRRQVVWRICVYALIALIGGAAAGVSFAVARPLAEKYLVPEETTESIPITIPTDEELLPSDSSQIETPVNENDQQGTSPSESESETQETEPLEDILQSAIEKYEYTVDDLSSMYASLKSVVTAADNGIVVVHSVKQELDWFDNPVEVSGLYAGIVIASTSQELLILTPESAVENADSLMVGFNDNTEADGTIQQVDRISGMAVVSVDVLTLGEGTRKNVTALELGNSYGVRQGDLVVAVGAPSGMVHSSTYGFISHVLRNVQVADGITRLLFADIKGNAKAGTFLLNTSGQVVGWVTDEYKNEQNTNLTTVMAISDYKTSLERMSNGVPIPYLGIKGQEVSATMTSSGLPMGLYVADSILDGPAYNAGIQNGDVIVRMGSKPIITIMDYENEIASLNLNDEITITVQRKGIDEYKELEYQVTVGAR